MTSRYRHLLRGVFCGLVAVLVLVLGVAGPVVARASTHAAYTYDAASNTSATMFGTGVDGEAAQAPNGAPIAAAVGELSAAPEGFVAAETAASFGTESGQAVFWSGLGRNGASQAAEYAAKTGGTTLEQTAGGASLPAYDSANAASVAAWRSASQTFARGASALHFGIMEQS